MALYKEHTESTIMVIRLFSLRDVTNSGPLKLLYQSALHSTNPAIMYIRACHLQLLFYIWEVMNSLILVATHHLPIPISSHGHNILHRYGVQSVYIILKGNIIARFRCTCHILSGNDATKRTLVSDEMCMRLHVL
jgi:hypothetical protein